MESVSIVQMVQDGKIRESSAAVFFEPGMDMEVLLHSIVKYNLGDSIFRNAVFFGIIHQPDVITKFAQEITDSFYRNKLYGLCCWGDEYLKELTEKTVKPQIAKSQTDILRAFARKYPNVIVAANPSGIPEEQRPELAKFIMADNTYHANSLEEVRKTVNAIRSATHAIHMQAGSLHSGEQVTIEIDLDPKLFVSFLMEKEKVSPYWKKRFERLRSLRLTTSLNLEIPESRLRFCHETPYFTFKRNTLRRIRTELHDFRIKELREFFEHVVFGGCDVRSCVNLQKVKTFDAGDEASSFILRIGKAVLDGDEEGSEWNE